MGYVIIGYTEDGDTIGAFDTYKRLKYYVKTETDESLGDIDVEEAEYYGA